MRKNDFWPIYQDQPAEVIPKGGFFFGNPPTVDLNYPDVMIRSSK